jgi:16S rRNA (guanine527-N7)-methyltransferase
VTSSEFRDNLLRRAAVAQLPVDSGLIEPLERYVRLLTRWNEKVNLTALTLDPLADETIDRLLIEPLAAAQFVQESSSPWWDVGSGGGSPAIPIKLLRPALLLTMVESRSRKAAFLRELVRELGLRAATVDAVRFEELAARVDAVDCVGLVTVRAVRADSRFVEAVGRVLRAGGQLLAFRQGADADAVPGFALVAHSVLLPTVSQPPYLASYIKN